jgi:hypothetical protein
MSNIEKYAMTVENNQRPEDRLYYSELSEFWDSSIGTNLDKLRAFTKYVPFAEFPKLFAKYEIFKKVLNVHGSIVECGVHQGAGLMTWSLLSSIFEPVNHIRKIIGFDTFDGFVDVAKEDLTTGNADAVRGSLAVNSFADLEKAVRINDRFRPLGHIGKVELVKGDARSTIKTYLENNPHLVVSLLYLDFDLFEPTKIAIELLRSRMPKGAIICFDELNVKQWPGETQAVITSLGINTLRIERFYFHPQISYAILD